MFFIYKNRKNIRQHAVFVAFFEHTAQKTILGDKKRKKEQPRERVAPNKVYRTAKSHGDIRQESYP